MELKNIENHLQMTLKDEAIENISKIFCNHAITVN